MRAELIPITLQLPSEEIPRTPGIHVSRVIRAIAGETGLLKKEYCEDLSLVEVGSEGWWDGLDEVSKLRISLGLAWEEWYAKVLAEQMGVIFHPGEVCVDGIYMTPDGESLAFILSTTAEELGYLAIHEIKLTYKSTNTVGDLLGQWMWLAQVKAYCKAKGTRVAYVHVYFVCGDYSYPIRPMLRCWRVTFSGEEIEAGWELITGYVQHQQAMEREALMKDTEDANGFSE